MKKIVIVLALVLQAAVSAADSDQERGNRDRGQETPEQVLRSYREDRPNDLPRGFAALRIGTWNTMLQPWLPYEDRVIEVIQSLSKASLDVIHLQEVWTEEARDRILAAVGKKYPYSYWVPAHQEPASCTPTEQSITDYISCLISHGTDTRTVEQPVFPIDSNCEFDGLLIALEHQSCAACLTNTMQNLPSGDPGAYAARDLCLQSKGLLFSHQGNVGRLILSRWPITDIEDRVFDTYSIRRVNTYATIRGVRFAFVHWPKNYLADADPSWGSLQTGALQPELAQALLPFQPGVVMGGFNSGPDYQPEGYNILLQNNYRPLFTNTPTYCAPQLQDFPPCGDFAAQPASIDNIFLRKGTGACLKATFANEDQSDHIGLAALCIVKTR